MSDRRAGAERPGERAQLHVTFVCSGKHLRSPMAEKMFAHQLDVRGLAGAVRVSSAGTGGWHAGDGADNRARSVSAMTAIRRRTAPPRTTTISVPT